MTNHIEAARAALDQYTAAIETEKRDYESALFEHRFAYRHSVSELTGVAIEDLPTYENRLPVYLGNNKTLSKDHTPFFLKAFNDGINVIGVRYRNGEKLYAESPIINWLYTGCNDDLEIFAFFPDPSDAAPFLDKLAALQTPAPVVEAKAVGGLDELTLVQMRDYTYKGTLRTLYEDADGDRPAIWDYIWHDVNGAGWFVTRGFEPEPPADKNDRYFYFTAAAAVWISGRVLSTQVEFIPTPAGGGA